MAISEPIQTNTITGLEKLKYVLRPEFLDDDTYISQSLNELLEQQGNNLSTQDVEQAFLTIVEPLDQTIRDPIKITSRKNKSLTGHVQIPPNAYKIRNFSMTDVAVTVTEDLNGELIFDIIPANVRSAVVRFWFDHKSNMINVQRLYNSFDIRYRNVSVGPVKGFHIVFGYRTDRKFESPDIKEVAV
jgi:hypothetical protein